MKRSDFLKLAAPRLSLAGCAAAPRRPVQGARGGDRRRLRRRHRREVHPPVGPVDRRGAGRARTRSSSPARSRTWCSAATPAWRRSAAATTACAATACRWCTTRSTAVDAAKKTVRLARGGDIALRAAGRLAGHRLHLRRGPGLRGGDARRPRAARLEGRRRRPSRCASSSSRCATAASTSSRSRSRPTAARPGPTSAPAWSRPTSSRPSRAPRCWCSTPIRTSPPRAALFKAAWKRPLPGHPRVPRQRQGGRRRRQAMTVKLEVEDVKGDVLNVVPPHRAGDIARAGRPDHHQQPLVRRRLAHHGVEGGAGRPRARRRDAVGARHAQVGQHGQQPRQDRRRGDRRAAQRPRRRSR